MVNTRDDFDLASFGEFCNLLYNMSGARAFYEGDRGTEMRPVFGKVAFQIVA